MIKMHTKKHVLNYKMINNIKLCYNKIDKDYKFSGTQLSFSLKPGLHTVMKLWVIISERSLSLNNYCAQITYRSNMHSWLRYTKF